MSKNKRNTLSFIGVFLLSTILFGSLAGAGLALWGSPSRARTESAGSDQAPSQPVEERNTDILLWELTILLTDGDETLANVLWLSVFENETKQLEFTVTAIPRDTAVDDGVQSIRLTELFARDGVADTRAAVTALMRGRTAVQPATEQPPLSYLVMDYAGLSGWIGDLGQDVRMDSDEALTYSEENRNTRLLPGNWLLTGTQAAALLRTATPVVDAENTADEEILRLRTELGARLTAALLEQYLTKAKNIEPMYEQMLSHSAETDVKIAQFTAAKPYLARLAIQQTLMVRTAVLAGEYVGVGDSRRYEPNA